MYSFVRTILFCILFAMGFGAMSISLLAPEFDIYYNNLRYKEYVDYQIKILEDTRVLYTDKLSLLYGDPDIKYRLGKAIFGVEPKKPDTIFPEPGEELKDESLIAVQDIMGQPLVLTQKPQWIKEINTKKNNDVLLYGGILLIFLSMFVFTDPVKTADQQEAEDNAAEAHEQDSEDVEDDDIDYGDDDDDANNYEEDEEEDDIDYGDDDDDANNYEEDDEDNDDKPMKN